MLCQLCGDNALAKVVLGTTHWGEVDENKGKMHEQQFNKTFWKDSGLKSLRFDRKESSARAFLDVILGQLEFGGNEVILEGRDLPRFTSSQSTDVDSTIQNDPERTGMNDHPVMILCVFSRLLLAIGTDSCY